MRGELRFVIVVAASAAPLVLFHLIMARSVLAPAGWCFGLPFAVLTGISAWFAVGAYEEVDDR